MSDTSALPSPVVVLPKTATLDASCREALASMVRGEAFDAKAILRQLIPDVQAKAETMSLAAQEWVRENADCLTCGACCEQGWRVDVRESDLSRMTPATRAAFVVAPTVGAPPDVVGVLKILQTDAATHTPCGKCAAQTAFDGKGCSIYEERPEVCRTFPKGHERCVQVRVARGLPIGP